MEVEREKERSDEATHTLEREKHVVGGLRRDLNLEKDQIRSIENKHRAKLAELKTQLEMERARREELDKLV